VILTGQTRLRFGSVRFNLVHFGRMRCQVMIILLITNYSSIGEAAW